MATLEVVQEYPTLNITEERTTLLVGEFAAFSKDIGDLNQVTIGTLADRDVLIYDSGTTQLVNTNIDTAITKATQTKTYTAAEDSTITLSDATTTPIVSATIETAQTGVSASEWDVAVDGANFDIEDTAYAVTLTPSATTGAITVTLGSGVWTAADVGKTIAGNGGEAVITSQAGTAVANATTTTDFTDTSGIASGSWTLSGLSFTAGGVTLSGSSFTPDIDLSTASYDSKSFSLTTQDATAIGFAISADGSKLFYLGTASDTVYQYSISTYDDITTLSYDSVSFSIASQTISPAGISVSPDGSKFYIGDGFGGVIYQFSFGSTWSLSGSSYDSKSYDIASEGSNPRKLLFNNDASVMYVLSGSNDTIFQYTVATPNDITTSSYASKSLSINAQDTTPLGIARDADGSSFYVIGGTGDTIYRYNLTTSFDLSTGSYATSSFSVATQTTSPASLEFTHDYTKAFVLSSANDTVYQYSVATPVPTYKINTYEIAETNASGQIDTTLWTDVNSMTVTETLNGGNAYYLVSNDDKTTWQVAKASDGVRDVVRNNAGTWEYNSNVTYGSTTWTSATSNTQNQAIRDAMGVTANQMTGTIVDAIADGFHFTFGTTLDLAIILYTTTASNIPLSDGISVNYDGNVFDRGAINGTDYTWTAPSSTSVKITSITAGNYKVRII